jgi:hypothetical protein
MRLTLMQRAVLLAVLSSVTALAVLFTVHTYWVKAANLGLTSVTTALAAFIAGFVTCLWISHARRRDGRA